VKRDQSRLRIEVTRLQLEELSKAEEILLLKLRKRGRTHQNLLENKGVYIEARQVLRNITSRCKLIQARVELDDDIEHLPKRKFITRSLEKIRGRKQLDFVFEYRKEGCTYAYVLMPSAITDIFDLRCFGAILPRQFRSRWFQFCIEEDDLTPGAVDLHESRPSISPLGEVPPEQAVPSTRSQHDVAQVEIGSEATREREGTQNLMAIKTDRRVNSHAVQAQQSSPIPIKEEDDVFTQSMKGSFPGNWLASLRDKRDQPTKESAKPCTMQTISGPTHRQNLIVRIREAEVSSPASHAQLQAYQRTDTDEQSLIEAEQRRIEEEDKLHEQLLCTLKATSTLGILVM
jgi:hypothetical protein